jgi:hypothetical protein
LPMRMARRRLCRRQIVTRPLAVVSAGPKAVAKPRVIVHQTVFPRPFPAGLEFRFHGNFSSEGGQRNNPSHRTMPNQALSPGDRRVISAEASEIPQNQAF